MSVLRFNPIFDILILRRYSMISYDHNFFDGSSKIPNRSIMIFNNPSNHNHSAKTPPPPYDRRPLNFKTETLPNFQIQYIPEKQKQYMMRLTITSLVHLNAYITPHPSILSWPPRSSIQPQKQPLTLSVFLSLPPLFPMVAAPSQPSWGNTPFTIPSSQLGWSLSFFDSLPTIALRFSILGNHFVKAKWQMTCVCQYLMMHIRGISVYSSTMVMHKMSLPLFSRL